MARWTLGYQDRPTDTGFFIKKGALEVDGILPVTYNANLENAPIGVARDFQVDEETGEMTIDIELLPDVVGAVDQEHFHAHFYADQLEWEPRKEPDPDAEDKSVIRVLLKGRVRMIFLTADGFLRPNTIKE